MNLLLTGAWNDANTQIEKLKKEGHEVEFIRFEKDEIPCSYEWVEGVVCNGLFLSHPIEKFVNLRYIQLTSAGFDRVPIDYIKKKHIAIYNARGVYSVPMAEYALLKILEIYKKSSFFYENQKQHRWEKNREVLELSGKTAAIIGCGSVGLEIAKRLRAFDTYVFGVDVTKGSDKNIDEYRTIDEIEDVLSESDIVILTLPLTEATYHLFNKKFFNVMKQSGILVNISRGSIIKQSDLTEALRNRVIMAAVLDVFEDEPLDVNSELWDMDNVIITPHNSFIGNGNRKRLTDLIFKNIKEWNEGNV